jgi:hypothetical protein
MLLGRWILSDAEFSALAPVRRRRAKPTPDQQRALSRARTRAGTVLALGVALLVAGVVLDLVHHPLTGAAPLVCGVIAAYVGERGFARVQLATDRARPGIPERGPDPNSDAVTGAGSHGHF